MLNIDFDDPETVFIRYSRSDGLAEQALIPLQCRLIDGSARWTDDDGIDFSVEQISDVGSKDYGKALFTAIRTEIGTETLKETLRHFRNHQRKYPGAKMLVVTASIADANRRQQDLATMGIHAPVASADNPRAAKEAINAFKYDPGVPVLVSISMAYEGLSVPEITHIACLTRIRSAPWLEQMLARATRFDPKAGPWEEQKAYIFGPDDPLFRQVLDEIRADQAPFAIDIEISDELEEGGRSADGGTASKAIIPLASMPSKISSFDFDTGMQIDLDRLRQAANASGADISEEALQAMQAALSETEVEVAPMSAKEECEDLRQKIESAVRRAKYTHGVSPKTMNSRLLKYYGTPRPEMDLEQLRIVYSELPQRLADIASATGTENTSGE